MSPPQNPVDLSVGLNGERTEQNPAAVVPLNPTNDMLAAGLQAMFEDVRFSRDAKIMRRGYKAMLAAAPSPRSSTEVVTVDAVASQCHKLDTPTQVFFYEQDFYVLSNFSAFSIRWDHLRFQTSEAVYHFEKFNHVAGREIQSKVLHAASAHEAFKIAERNKPLRRPDWDWLKVPTMRTILHAKVEQHEYVRRKLLATGDRELIEDSWRDDYWGWGPNRDGQNMLGKLWMEIRAELSLTDGVTEGRKG